MTLSPEALSLPAATIAAAVNESLSHQSQLVITAPPGAGKSTLLPLTMLEALPADGKILMLEPRRIAARQIAERMAETIGETVGQTVGYRIRFESRISSATRIEVLTEGILSRMLIDDPALEGVSIIIFDEFHERSIYADVALALSREAQQILRPDLRLVIMSATIDATAICRMLDAPLIECGGRMYHVEVRHEAECDASDCAEVVAHAVRCAHTDYEGDILVFLPGEADIRRVEAMLTGRLGSTHIYPLYGMLPQSKQKAAIAPSRHGERKVVLATPIAETSLTIEGVRVVVDSGLCRRMVFDAQNGLSRLQTVRISHDMADQRMGRAGRVAPGVCIRLWSAATHHRMADNRTPEIETADLAPLLLDIAAWGERDAERLAWLTPPPHGHLMQAALLLHMLRAIDDNGSITPHGRRLSALPCHPRIAQMMLCATDNASKALSADIAAIVEEKDPLAKDGQNTDINLRIDTLRRYRSAHREGNGPWQRIAKIAEQYRRLTGAPPDDTPSDAYAAGSLLAAAYPERIASVRDAHRGLFLLSSGNMAMLPKGDDMASEEWIVAANVDARDGVGRIFLASALNPRDLQSMLTERDNISWDAKKGAVEAQREYRIGQLMLGAKPLKDVDTERIIAVICGAAQRDGERMFNFDDSTAIFQRRVATAAAWHPELNLPQMDTSALLERCEEWLPLYLGKATTAAELKKIDMVEVMRGMLSFQQQQQLDSIAPSHIEVPTGSRIRLDYRLANEMPVLRVRLQEVFGLVETPRVDNGRRSILMELLSPGYRPVQLTQDLANFWRETYFEVRKELKRRYPKHSWPDNPLEAQAIRGVKKR